MHALQQWRRCALTLATALALVATPATALATEVSPVGGRFAGTNDEGIRLELVDPDVAVAIVCDTATYNGSIPGEETNPHEGGSVFNGFPTIGGTLFVESCAYNGEPVSGGVFGATNVAWNNFSGTRVATVSTPLFNFWIGGCQIWIDLFVVQPMFGEWTNGEGRQPSTLRFTEQSLIGSATESCEMDDFDRAKFEGTFDVLDETGDAVLVA